jgi:hypothetical protein
VHRSADVYWTSTDSNGGANGAVMKAPLAGGTPLVLASGQSKPGSIAVDARNVYWMTTDIAGGAGAIMRIPLGGGDVCQASVCSAAPFVATGGAGGAGG